MFAVGMKVIGQYRGIEFAGVVTSLTPLFAKQRILIDLSKPIMREPFAVDWIGFAIEPDGKGAFGVTDTFVLKDQRVEDAADAQVEARWVNDTINNAVFMTAMHDAVSGNASNTTMTTLRNFGRAYQEGWAVVIG